MDATGCLKLSDGSSLEGTLIGKPIVTSGELVFTTGMVGYSEAITDPSYFGQILIFAYPLIGNYGVPDFKSKSRLALPVGLESRKPRASAILISSTTEKSFHWKYKKSLHEWLKTEGVVGLAGVDTRALIKKVRNGSLLLGSVGPLGRAEETFFDPNQINLLPEVSTPRRQILGKGRTRIALVDCGAKWNILRHLLSLHCEIEVLPWDTDLRSIDCNGWIISNGPGDPKRTGDLTQRISHLLKDSKPILGICLGHQLLALAAGGTTHRMPFGHRGHNQPVFEVKSQRAFMTTQNHGYVVDKTLPEGWKPWFLNANDQTVEGICHEEKPFRAVQFHPEAAGGPQDTGWILAQFVDKLR